MSSHFSGTVHLGQDNTLPNPSHTSAATFLSQSDVTLSASNSNVKMSLRQSILNYSMGAQSLPFSTLSQYSSGDNVTDVSRTSSYSVVALQANESLDVLDTRPLSNYGASFTLSSSQLDAGLSASHYPDTLSSSHLNVPSSHDVMRPPSRYDGSTSKLNYLVTQSTSQDNVTFSSGALLVSVLPSHSVIKLSLEKSQVMQSVTLKTLQRTHHNTGYSSLETINILSTSPLGEKIVTHTNHASRVDLSSRKTDTSTQNRLSALPYFYTPSIFALNKSIVTNINSAAKTSNTSEKARHDHMNTSNVLHSASLPSGVSFQFSVLFGTFIPSTGKRSQDGIASLVYESTLTRSSLSVHRDTPLSVNPNPNTMDTSHASPVDSSINGNSSDKSSSGSSLMNYSVENSSAHHRYMQMVQLSKPENITHIQTRLTSIISNANKSSLSIHKLSLLKNNLDATLTKKCNHSSFPSSNIIYHFISDVSILTDSSSDFLRDIYTNRLALSSVQSLDRTTFPTKGFKATIAKLSSFSKASGKRSYCCFIAYEKLFEYMKSSVLCKLLEYRNKKVREVWSLGFHFFVQLSGFFFPFFEVPVIKLFSVLWRYFVTSVFSSKS